MVVAAAQSFNAEFASGKPSALIEKVDPSAIDAHGYSILQTAIRYGNEAAVIRLLERGADPSYLFCQFQTRDHQKCATGLGLFLSDMGRSQNVASIVRLFIKNGSDVNGISRGRTPLIIAIGGASLAAAEALLAAAFLKVSSMPARTPYTFF